MASQPLLIRIQGDPAGFKSAMDTVKGELDKAGIKFDTVAGKVGDFGKSMSQVGQAMTLGITAPILGLAAGAIKAATDLDSLKRGLEATMKSADKAASEFKALQEVARLPGLGLQEAVQGSIRLQTLGVSAERSRVIMREFGNALSIVGGTKVDFGEVIRQLSQLAAVGKVTKENLDPIIERIPQVAAIIREKFGPEALGDPGKVFAKLGIDSQKLIQILTEELGKLERSTGGPKAAFENLQDAIQLAAARIGDKLLPAVIAAIPVMESMVTKAADMVDAFLALPEPIRNTGLAISGLIIAAGPLLTVAGKISEVSKAIGGMAGAASLLGGSAAVLAAGFVVFDRLQDTAENIRVIGHMAMGAARSFTDTVAPVQGLFAVLDKSLTPAVKTAWQSIDFMRLQLLALSPGLSVVTDGVSILAKVMARLSGTTVEQIKFEIDHAKTQRDVVEGWIASKKAAEGAAGATEKHAVAITKATQAASDHIKVNTVMLDQFGNLSKTSLVYVEMQERVRSAVGKVKDVMYEYAVAGTAVGKVMELQRMGLDRLAEASNRYAESLKGLSNALLEVVNQSPFPRVAGFPELPNVQPQIDIRNRPQGVGQTDAILSGMGVRSQRELRAEADRLGDSYERIVQLQRQNQATVNDVRNAYEAWHKAEVAASLGGAAAVKQAAKENTAAVREINRAISSVSRGITEVIFAGEKWGATFKRIGLNIAADLTQSVIESGIKKVIKELGLLDAALGNTGGLFGKIFGGGTGMIMNATGGAGGAAGTATGSIGGIGSPAGGGASSALGSVTNIIGAVGSVVSAISGVIGNFQMAHMNTALGRIEESTRYLKIYTGEQSQSILWSTQKTAEYIQYAVMELSGISKFSSEMLGNLQQIAQHGTGGGGITINNHFAPGSIGAGLSQQQVKVAFSSALNDTVAEFKRMGLNR